MSSEHVHRNLCEEIRSIGGYYQVLEEARLTVDDREVLYLVEIGCVETSCCGAGGIPFIHVPGYVISWQSHTDKNGCPVSEVERIVDEAERTRIAQEIAKQLAGKYPHFNQISFA